jgi:two-component system capsular synthesis sensor histidine kinase RcsC
MGSQFTIRIPLYGAVEPAPADVDGLANTCCWLAVHNASLNSYGNLLTHNGIQARL